MYHTDKKYIGTLRSQYPAGTRIRLTKQLNDQYTQIPAGECCTVCYVDDIGTIHVAWDCGSSLGLIPEEDSFEKL